VVADDLADQRTLKLTRCDLIDLEGLFSYQWNLFPMCRFPDTYASFRQCDRMHAHGKIDGLP